MARTRRPRRPRLTIGLLVLASITIITLDYRGDAHGSISSVKSAASDAFSPIQRAVDDVTHPIGSFLAGAVNGGQLEEENAKLRQEVGRAATAGAGRGGDAERPEGPRPARPTAVDGGHPDGHGPGHRHESVRLRPPPWSSNVGAADGVEVGMPVVGGAGLVGQRDGHVVEDVHGAADHRRVGSLQVGVSYGPASTDVALTQGAGIGKPLSVNDVTPGAALHQGEVLTTSGLPNAAYPAAHPGGPGHDRLVDGVVDAGVGHGRPGGQPRSAGLRRRPAMAAGPVSGDVV